MLDQLAQYKILDRIGAGGMGEVFRARDTRLGRTVAIKILKRDVAGDEERRARFMREARVAAALSHPGIATIYEIGEEQDQLFLVFEFVPGETLRTAIGGQPLNPRRAIETGVQIADALAYAHASDVIHRDIKPDNVIVTPSGHAKVLDFGLAKWTAGGAVRDLATTMMETAGASALGTVAYMSPEQALGHALDHRTDLFSLGVVLHEMLTGELPFRGATPTAVALQIVQAASPPPSTVNASVPRELDRVVLRALEKDPAKRYDSAATLAAELRAVGRALEAQTPPAAYSPPGGSRARRSLWPALAAALLVAAVATGGWLGRDRLGRVWRRTIGPAPQPIIAVVPLELANADPAQRYFADGLTEDLITRLGQTPGLRVIGRSATRNYRGRDPRDLARELGAGVVLTGSVRPGSDVVRVSLELIDPSDSTALWTAQYTRELKDILAVQSQVADEVARALRVALQPTAARERTASRLVDERAYDTYLRGRQAASERNVDLALQLFTEATRLDDGLAEAHAGITEALHLQWVFLGAPDDPARRARLKRAAERAAELDPDLPQANLAGALAADRLSDALDSLKRAIAVDPTFSEGFHQLGDQIQDFDPARAIQFYRRTLALDPRMDVNHADIVSALSALGRFADARAELAAVPDEQDRGGWKTPLRLAVSLDEKRFDDAIATLEHGNLMQAAPVFTLSYVNALRMAGRGDAAYQQATWLVARGQHDCEANAALAGLRQERRELAAARALVAPTLRAAAAPDAGPSMIRCAALSAAAIGDAPAAAALLRRIAGDERLLRYWAVEITGTTGSKMLRRNMFPWPHVHDQPPVVDARRALDDAYARMKSLIAASLDKVTP